MGVLEVAFVSLLVARVLAQASSLPCSPDVSETFWVVEDAAGASALASAINCSGGVFDVEWRGFVEFPRSLFVTNGSFLNITGTDADAVANGGGKVQFLNVVDSTMHVSGLRIENCLAILGGGISAHGSTIHFNQTSFSGNTADVDGGALYVDACDVSWSGETIFSGNSAGYDGGALVALDSTVSWSGETIFSNNTSKGDDGGASFVSGSDVSWSGETIFSGNTANSTYSSGGALFMTESNLSWSGETNFSGNIAGNLGGALYVGACDVSWSGETSFSGNSAGYDGGALAALDSTVSWSGETIFSNNTSKGDDGGASFVSGSDVSWSGETIFSGNTANSTYSSGGALFMTESNLSWSGETNFSGNIAGNLGGALHVEKSNLLWKAGTIFSENTAGDNGGALCAYESDVSWSGETTFSGNSASGSDGSTASLGSFAPADDFYGYETSNQDHGGALCAYESVVSWSGETTFSGNSAAYEGGALFVGDSNVSWSGETSFLNNHNILFGYGAALCALGSEVSWSGETSFSGNSANADGGALYAESSSVSWSGETSFSGNSALGGGALWAYESDVSWSAETSFLSNTADFDGGALKVDGCDVSWSAETSFLSNTADSDGGALHAGGSDVSWSAETSFSGNTAGKVGGALWAYESDVSWSGDTVFSGNTAYESGGALALIETSNVKPGPVGFERNTAEISGGALYMLSVKVGPTFFLANFTANNSTQGSAVYAAYSGLESLNPTTFDECYFRDNRASASGGAIESAAGKDEIVNTYFVGNVASTGGALRLGGSAKLDGCTFTDNVSHENNGPAVSNIGTADINGTRFTGNVFWCEVGNFQDTIHATIANVTRYEKVCDGCGACDACEVEDDDLVPVCTAQMENTQSEGGDATIETLKLDRGFWRATTSSRAILACFNEEACAGGQTGASRFCQTGYEGPYCSVCSAGFSMTTTFTCTKCVNSRVGIVIVVTVVVLVLCVAIALCMHLMSSESDGGRQGIVRWFTKRLPLQSVKIVVVVWQIVTQFASVANVRYPSVYQRFLDGVNVLNFDVLWIPSAGCVVNVDFHDRLVASTIGPLVVLALLAATYTIAKRRSSGSEEALQKIRHKHVSMLLLISFLVYSSVSATVFQTFACDGLDDGNEYLRADYRIKCTSSKHQAFELFAGVMIFVYPAGIPAFYAILLYKSRRVLQSKTEREASVHAQIISDLWVPYKPGRFYYELIECLRRILLTGLVVFIYPNTAAQVSVTLVIAFAFVVVSQNFAPFVSKWDARVSLTGHVVVFLSMYLALLSKVDVSGERASSRKVFAGIIVAAHACMVTAIVVEAVVMFTSVRGSNGREHGKSIRPRAFSKPSLFPPEQPCS